MRLSFDTSLSEKYNSSAQKIRVMSESWLGDNMIVLIAEIHEYHILQTTHLLQIFNVIIAARYTN